MRKLLVRPQARVGLLEIWHHIAPENLAAANGVGEAFESAILDLSAMPGMGHVRPDVKDGHYRFWRVYSYVIAYRYDATMITVLRVVHGRRDFRRLFPGDR